MPDWLLAISRFVWAPVRWVARRIRRHAIDRQELVREGSAVVTPVIQYTRSLGPASIHWGSDEENRAKMQERSDQWPELRDALMTYANHHPSDRVRRLAEEVERAVMVDLNRTAVLLHSRKTATTMESLEDSERSHTDALDKTERLMDEIRRY